MKPRRYQVLEKLIKQHGWTKGAEIGIFKGSTFFYLLEHCPDLHLIGVDAWDDTEKPHAKNMTIGLSTWRKPEVMQQYAAMVKEKAKLYPNATVLHMDSVDAAATVADASLDFIFVDAEHTTEAVLADVKAWSPKVRAGGLVLGHDEEWVSVRRALKALYPRWTKYPDNVWSFP